MDLVAGLRRNKHRTCEKVIYALFYSDVNPANSGAQYGKSRVKKLFLQLTCLLFVIISYSVNAQKFIDLALFPEDMRISGTEPMGGIGHFVVSGDVNGDGYSDIMAAGQAAETYHIGGGAAFLIFGSPEPLRFISTSFINGVTTFWGNHPQDYTGAYLDCFDYSDDRIKDIFIGAPQWTYEPKSSLGKGKIYYFSGRAHWPRDFFLEDYPQSAEYCTLWGQYPQAHLGYRLEHGDLNGDGIEDLIAGVGMGCEDRPINQRRAVYVILGGQNLSSGSIESSDLSICKIIQPSAADPAMLFRSSDLDLDGYDDLFITFHASFDEYKYNGRIFIIWGRPDFPQIIELDNADDDTMVSTIFSNRDLSCIGNRIYICDFNDNNMPDIIIQQYEYNLNKVPDNAVNKSNRYVKYFHVLYDYFIQRHQRTDFFDNNIKRIVIKDSCRFQSEFGVAGCVADWDYDGVDDLILTNYRGGRNNKDKAREGFVYIIYGGQTLADTLVIDPYNSSCRMTTVFGGTKGSWLGSSVTSDDLNNDGLQDLILGAWATTTSAGEDGGEVYVLLNQKTNKESYIPTSFKLFQPFPNPFSTQLQFKFHLESKSLVELNVYNVMGKRVRNIYNAFLDEGVHWSYWNGRNDLNQLVSSGTYFIVVKRRGQIKAKKVVFFK